MRIFCLFSTKFFEFPQMSCFVVVLCCTAFTVITVHDLVSMSLNLIVSQSPPALVSRSCLYNHTQNEGQS